MKIKQMLHYQIGAIWRSIIAFYGIMIGIFILGTILSVTFDKTTFSFGDPDVMSSIYVLVVGACLYKEPLFIGLANGVSRRTSFLSFLIISVLLSAIVAICNSIVLPFFSHVISFQIADFLYGNLEMNGWTQQAVKLLLSVAMSMAFMLLGYVVGGVYYRMGKFGKVAVTVSVPLLTFLLLPVIFSILPVQIQQAIGTFFGDLGTFIIKTPWNLIAILCGTSLLFILFGWLLIRKSPIKA